MVKVFQVAEASRVTKETQYFTVYLLQLFTSNLQGIYTYHFYSAAMGSFCMFCLHHDNFHS